MTDKTDKSEVRYQLSISVDPKNKDSNIVRNQNGEIIFAASKLDIKRKTQKYLEKNPTDCITRSDSSVDVAPLLYYQSLRDKINKDRPKPYPNLYTDCCVIS